MFTKSMNTIGDDRHSGVIIRPRKGGRRQRCGSCHDEYRHSGEDLGGQGAHRYSRPSGGSSENAGQKVETPLWCSGPVHVYEGTAEAFSGIHTLRLSVSPTHEGSPLNDERRPRRRQLVVVRRAPRSSERVTPCRCWGSTVECSASQGGC